MYVQCLREFYTETHNTPTTVYIFTTHTERYRHRHTHMHAHMHTHACTHTCIHTTHTHRHAYTHAHTYIHTHTRTYTCSHTQMIHTDTFTNCTCKYTNTLTCLLQESFYSLNAMQSSATLKCDQHTQHTHTLLQIYNYAT